MPTGRSSTISTDAPRRASSWATAQPTIPAPTTMISEGARMIVYTPTPCKEAQMSVASNSVLTGELLQRCRERAAGYDRDNRFCQEDFDELKDAGYLLMAVPKELG